MEHQQRYRTAAKVTAVSASVNTFLALSKILIGVIGHSQALLADGIHSFSDLITDTLIIVTAKVSGQQPDQEHPYGHRRFETLATVIIALILMGAAAGIAYDTLHPLLHKIQQPRPHFSVIIVAIISIIANEGLYRYTLALGKKINSSLLISNAWHNRSDALTSVIVLVSSLGSMLHIHYLDAIGALVIAAFIIKIAITMLWQSAKELIDTGVETEMLNKIKQTIANTPGVNAIHQLRTRSHGSSIFVDVHIQVNPKITVSEGHYISDQVSLMLSQQCTNIDDVTVHIDPEDDEIAAHCQHLPNRATLSQQLNTAWQDCPGHQYLQNIVLHYLSGQIIVEIFLPFSLIANHPTSKQTLERTYRQAIENIHTIKQLNFYYC